VTGEQLASGLIALSGVVVGASIKALSDRWGWKRGARLDAGLLLARTYELIWGDRQHSNLVIHLASLRMHLLGLGVARERIEELEHAAYDCWRSGREHITEGVYPTDGHGVSGEAFERFTGASGEIERKLFTRGPVNA